MPTAGDVAHEGAVSALRIQCFELNRGHRPGYGDSIEAESFGGVASRETAGPSEGQSCTNDAGGQPCLPKGFFHGVLNTRSGSANREPTVTSKGGRDSGDRKGACSQA